MDQDGYPTDDELKEIKEWDLKDPLGLMHYIQDYMWWHGDHLIKISKETLEDNLEHPYIKITMSTVGWSGNEEIIGVLMEKTTFWMMNWYSSHRGGYYEFHIPIKKKND